MYQLVVVRRIGTCIWTQPNRKPGDVVWLKDLNAARHLIEAGLCKWPEVTPKPEKKLILRLPDGWPVDRFGVIERNWSGETVVCIGGGPSLTEADLEVVRKAHESGRCKVIVVNDQYLVAPWADVLYFADYSWWQWHTDGIRKSWPWVSFTSAEVKKRFAEFAGQKCTIENTGLMVADPNVFMLHNYGSTGLSDRPNGLHTGMNGGYQVVNLAVLAGGNPILLLAYDMRFHGKRTHSHNGHQVKHTEHSYKDTYARQFPTMLPQLARLGVRVVNCTPGSAIGCFPFSTIERELA